jgi:hypothetical protein
MSPKQTWHAWIKALIERFGTAKACAEFLEIDESKLSRWQRAYFQEPTASVRPTAPGLACGVRRAAPAPTHRINGASAPRSRVSDRTGILSPTRLAQPPLSFGYVTRR